MRYLRAIIGTIILFLILTSCSNENNPVFFNTTDTDISETPSLMKNDGTFKNYKLSKSLDLYVPCANEGEGENITFQVETHYVIKESTDRNGTIHLNYHIQEKGYGVGNITNLEYRYSHQSRLTRRITADDAGGAENFYNKRTTRVSGQGHKTNFFLQISQHFISNGNGDIVLQNQSHTVECE